MSVRDVQPSTPADEEVGSGLHSADARSFFKQFLSTGQNMDWD